ncbi:ubiquinone/menaquinone biosynthesis C-methylase UbiE [Lederbergia galactosidilyticus]|uniref:methyltransferase domain-containing protein n=1 Tax=Lederbergia galactosidilytica TaxID=217031 RepID=UPI001E17895F|nr:methyltransferase domain-containing protein [Lederbergia galactosidilytica]MBP1915031.1 ubiquinone/menaquinone biosynthesis C-methylase UbiE [Lederbergia galactosidilytica]
MDIAKQRAVLADSKVIHARSLEKSHKRLALLLKPGMTVLDLGCGTGAITAGIAEKVGPQGRVIGIDHNPNFINQAKLLCQHMPWVTFEVGDIYQIPYEGKFDIVTAARVLQWLSNPHAALEQMIRAAKIDGYVIALDYNHPKISWVPEPPNSMQRFYQTFLSWRDEAGMDNEIADHLAEMMKHSGLDNIVVTSQNEKTERKDEDFQTHISVWASVVASRGLQMVKDGFLTEQERTQVGEEYEKWIQEKAETQIMYLKAVEGRKTH